MTITPVHADLAGLTAVFEGPARVNAVDVYVHGVRYPGEVVMAAAWEQTFGAPLGDGLMFRVVLVASAWRPAAGEPVAAGVAVAAPPDGPAGPNGSLRPIAAEAVALRETLASYTVSPDTGLAVLTATIAERERELADRLAGSLGARWAAGRITAQADTTALDALRPALAHAGPGAWVEALASWIITQDDTVERPRLAEPLTPERAADLFRMIALPGENVSAECEEIGRALGLESPLHGVAARADGMLRSLLASRDPIAGSLLREHLEGKLRLPPDLSALFLVDFVRRRDAELLVAATDGAEEARVNRDTLPDTAWDPSLTARLLEVRGAPANDWDAALPYLRLIYPDARPRAADGGGDRQETEFAAALRSVEARAILAASVRARLQRALGGGQIPVGEAGPGPLTAVLAAPGWRDFRTRARESFGSIRRLREALKRDEQGRSAVASAGEIVTCVRFLDSADFGAANRGLELEARALRARFDTALIDSIPQTWPPLHDDFERWREDYRKAYRAAHAARRGSDEDLERRMAHAIVEIAAIEGFAQIPELGPPPDTDLTSRYEELAVSLAPCPSLEHDVPLVEHPFCETCGVTLRSPASRPDIDTLLFEIASVLGSYNRRLSSVAAREALAGRNPGRLDRLLRLDAASDLSALSEHLSGDVIDFLREFLAEAGAPDAAT